MALLHRSNKQQPTRRRAPTSQNNSFQRSRTLTGSVSSDVKSAGEERGVLKSERLRKQELQRLQRLVALGIAVITAVIIGIFYLISQYTFQSPKVVAADENLNISSEMKQVYSQSIMKYLQSHPAERFRFATSEKGVSSSVWKDFPEVKSIKGIKDGFEISFRKPLAVWQIGQKEYFVDDEGQSFENNYYTAPTVTVSDKSGIIASNRNVMVGKGFLSFLGRIVALVNSSGLGTVTEAVIPAETTRELDIKLQDKPYIIKLHSDRVPENELEDLQRVVGYLDKKGVTPQYIDLRVSGKAYYR
jgi:hypothetical protein